MDRATGATGAYDDKGRPLASTGATAQQAEGRVVYEDKTDGVPAAAGVGGGGAAVYSDQGIKTGAEFESGQLTTGKDAGSGAHHEVVYDDHGRHVQGTAGFTGVERTRPLVEDPVLRQPNVSPSSLEPEFATRGAQVSSATPAVVVGGAAPVASQGAAAQPSLVDKAKVRTAGVVKQAQESLGHLKERLAHSQGTHEPANPSPVGAYPQETVVHAPLAGNPVEAAGRPVPVEVATSHPTASAGLGREVSEDDPTTVAASPFTCPLGHGSNIHLSSKCAQAPPDVVIPSVDTTDLAPLSAGADTYTTDPTTPMDDAEKKPLKERLKESAVKGIDKVQAALGQANERVTGVK